MSIGLNNSSPLPFFASITSCTSRLIDSAASPGSTTITGATVKGVLAVTGTPPLVGIAWTQTLSVSPSRLWSAWSRGICTGGTVTLTEKVCDSSSARMVVVVIPNLTSQRLEAVENPAINWKVPCALPSFVMVALKPTSSPGTTIWAVFGIVSAAT